MNKKCLIILICLMLVFSSILFYYQFYGSVNEEKNNYQITIEASYKANGFGDVIIVHSNGWINKQYLSDVQEYVLKEVNKYEKLGYVISEHELDIGKNNYSVVYYRLIK